jgi:enamine deaminase RidA (YjgF/YER057c/UK114 family)
MEAPVRLRAGAGIAQGHNTAVSATASTPLGTLALISCRAASQPAPINTMDSGAVLGPTLSARAVSLPDMTEIQLLSPVGLITSPAFSHVAVVPPDATTVYVGGQNAVDHNGELVGGTDVAAQTRQVMANLATALGAAGAGIEHLVSVLVLLVEGVDVQAAYGAAAAALGTAKAPPLVSAAIVSGLGVRGAMVEVSAVAAIPRADGGPPIP